MLLLPEGTDVQLIFDEDLSSKTAADGDEVTFVLADDLKVGDVVVAKAGAKAQGEVTNAKKSGMMGKAGELNVRLNYLKVGNFKVRIRGTKGKEGESGATGAIVLTVLFGPIGLIKHGKNIEIKKGTALKAYVADDIKLPPV
jgi:mannose-6-phosphate isomerase class I